MSDTTEQLRTLLRDCLEADVASNDPKRERERLESRYGKVWNTPELSLEFEVLGFLAPFCVVRRKSDGRKGSLQFQHNPRFYFSFEPE